MFVEKIKANLFKKYLFWRVRKGRIKRYIKRSLNYLSEKNNEANKLLRVGAVQLKMKLYHDPLDFAEKMQQITAAAVSKGVKLLVFPEDNLIQLAGMLPGIETGNSDINEEIAGGDININDVLKYIGPVIIKAANTIFSQLARKYNIYIMAGSGMLPGGDKVYNLAYLYSPEGRLMATQKKLHLLPLEDKWEIKTGDYLKVIKTEIGNLAFPICMDASYFETFRIASNLGADIVMIPIANPDPDYNYWTAMRGIWGRVQESGVYGIKSAMVGNFFGFKLTGQAGIYAPLELTPDESGILAEAVTYDQEEIVLADLDIGLLEIERQKNKALWERYFPDIYQNNDEGDKVEKKR